MIMGINGTKLTIERMIKDAKASDALKKRIVALEFAQSVIEFEHAADLLHDDKITIEQLHLAKDSVRAKFMAMIAEGILK